MILPSLEHIIGIWGYGRVGASAAHYFVSKGYTIAVMDSNRKVSSDNFLQHHKIPFFHQDDHDLFFNTCTYVLPSPGIDLKECRLHNHQWLGELDLFYTLWQKPIIAITGSVGKTTTASMLAQLCAYNNIPVALGGNIGTPMLDLLAQQNTVAWAILEVSSFQLEHCHFFAPDIAIITNLHQNHLDRHTTFEQYWHAKANIFMHQHKTHHIIAPLALYEAINACHPSAYCWYLTDQQPSEKTMHILEDKNRVVQLAPSAIGYYINKNYQTYEKPNTLFSRTFPLNALSIYTAFTIMQKKSAQVTHNVLSKKLFDVDYVSQPHRLEHVATHNGITFINDSKSTTIVSTLAALSLYKDHPIILLLGGLSKGANRKELIAQLPASIIYVACFGAEAAQLASWCAEYHFKANAYDNLELTMLAIMPYIKQNSIILLSPSGSSFDLYTNYEERGNHFKQLVQTLLTKKNASI